MLDAFADREDCRIAGSHLVVADDASFTVRPEAVAISVIGRMPALTTTMSVSSVEPSLNSRWVMRPSVRTIFVVIVLHTDLDAHAFDRLAKHVAGFGIELGHHQLRAGFENGHFDAMRQKTARCFQSEQSAADDRRAPAVFVHSRRCASNRRSCGTETCPSPPKPSIGGTKGRDPVAMMTWS